MSGYYNNHGGKREGAGKPALYGEPMERKNVMLDQKTIEFYTKIGGGNLSAGIRNHWRNLTTVALDLLKPCEICGRVDDNHMSDKRHEK